MEIIMPQMHAGQTAILNILNDPEVNFVTVNCGRRFGKTLLGTAWLFTHCITSPNLHAVWISRWYNQISTVMQDAERMFEGCPAIKKINRGNNSIHFTNGSIIKYFQSQNYDALRGERIDRCVLDEFALYRENVWEEVISPALSTSPNPKALFISTPKGKGKWYELFRRGDKAKRWRNYSAPSEANPFVSREYLEEAKASLPDKIYRQEYLAEFIEDAGALFENINSCVQKNGYPTNKNMPQLFCGIDVGFTQDYTVVTIVDRECRVWYYDRFNQVTMRDAAKRIANILKTYANPSTYIENNTYQGLYEMIIQEGGRNISVFQTTTESKKAIIENLIDLFQSKSTAVPNDKIFIDELNDFQYEYNPKTRNVRYAAPEGQHDDCVISLALACYIAKRGAVTFYHN